jgi:hypothetical protein
MLYMTGICLMFCACRALSLTVLLMYPVQEMKTDFQIELRGQSYCEAHSRLVGPEFVLTKPNVLFLRSWVRDPSR